MPLICEAAAVFLEDDGRPFNFGCAYCHTAEELTVVTFEMDHIVPLSAGGFSSFENLCLACPTCNRWKADRTMATDPSTGQLVPLFHPQLDGWSRHFAWSIAGEAIVPLTAEGRATVVALRMNRPQIVRVRRMWVAMDEHPPKLDSDSVV